MPKPKKGINPAWRYPLFVFFLLAYLLIGYLLFKKEENYISAFFDYFTHNLNSPETADHIIAYLFVAHTFLVWIIVAGLTTGACMLLLGPKLTRAKSIRSSTLWIVGSIVCFLAGVWQPGFRLAMVIGIVFSIWGVLRRINPPERERKPRTGPPIWSSERGTQSVEDEPVDNDRLGIRGE